MFWSSLTGSSASYAIASQLKDVEGLILTRQESEAEVLAKEMAYFRPELASRIVFIPDSETLPFDLERPSAHILSSRAVAIGRLTEKEVKNPIVISTVRNAMRLFTGERLWKNRMAVECGSPLAPNFTAQLLDWGYSNTYRTKSPGQFSVRGKVIDIYPVGGLIKNEAIEHGALRIRLGDDGCVAQIKLLDPLTQDSSGSHRQAVFLPMREYPVDKSIIEGFRKNAYENHGDARATDVYKTISGSGDSAELNWWMHFSDSGVRSIFDLIDSPQVILFYDTDVAVIEFDKLLNRRHSDVLKDSSRVIPNVDRCFLGASVFSSKLDKYNCITLLKEPRPDAVGFGYAVSGMQRMASLNESLGQLRSLIHAGGDTLFVIKSQVREKHMMVMANMMGFQAIKVESFDDFSSKIQSTSEVPRIYISTGDLVQGYQNAGYKYRLITEREIFGSVIESRPDEDISEHQRRIILQGLHEIELKEPLVHAMLGVGRFAGFERINMLRKAGMDEDVVKIAYADDAMAFVRIRDLDLVSRYSGGAPEKAPLTRLNDPAWMAGIKEAQTSAFAAAADLVKIRAQRERAIGISLKPADSRYDRFCEVFIYEETPDQLRAIEDIVSDLTSGRPMDRLVCGDVGFGKTEVAMRAAFLTASQGYQVVILAPTTILAEQHYQSFLSRFEETSIKIKLANKNSLNKSDLESIKNGDVSIIIGTHRLLQPDIVFDNLGLVVVDEEHRFGVRQKELLRQMRGNKHMLTLTATPIPRTLGMAIAGIRDLSILATPPARRQSVRTIVKEFTDDSLIVAMTRELARNGQIFYLHNLIETMDDCAAHLQQLMPEARIQKIHGKMSDMEMARVMMSFRRHEFDVLVSTTVIEIGIDVPNANTLIVEDADNLGLAQLHQLRGRVGRSSRQAYAYLLHEPNTSKTGMLRLTAMEKASNLGEGVMIARHDMEIRGIGEILGEEQSGHVHNIGFALYMRLLEQSVKALSTNKGSALSIMLTSVEMPLSGQIPDFFIEETGERLAWYQRLISSENNEELASHISELEDLYGYLPPEIGPLKASIEEHILLRAWGIKKVEQDGDGLRVSLHEDAPAGTKVMFELMFRGIENGDRLNQLVIPCLSVDSLYAGLLDNKRK